MSLPFLQVQGKRELEPEVLRAHHQYVVTSLAGPLAEHVYDPDRDLYWDETLGGDAEVAEYHAAKLFYKNEALKNGPLYERHLGLSSGEFAEWESYAKKAIGAYLEEAKMCAWELLNENYQAVEVVAEALMKRGEMTDRRVEIVLADARVEIAPYPTIAPWNESLGRPVPVEAVGAWAVAA